MMKPLFRRGHSAPRALSVALAVALVAVVLAASPALAQPGDEALPLVPTFGEYDVGTTAYHWVDESREEPHTDDPDDRRELLVEVWYPTAPDPDAPRAPYLPLPMVELMAATVNIPAERIAALQSNAIPDAPLLASEDPLPVVVFDPGFSIPPRQYTILLEEFASQGYVVFAVSHPYITALTVFPDGRAITAAPDDVLNTLWEPQDLLTGEFEHVWVPDALFVLDQIAALNDDDPQGRFTGRLALDAIGMVGHSQGGRTVSEVCLMVEQCAGAVNLDGAYSARVEVAYDKPYLMVQADNGVDQMVNLYRYGFPAAVEHFYVMMIPQSHHGSVYDYAVTVPLLRGTEPTEDELIAQKMLIDYRYFITAFLDTVVLGQPSDLLQGGAPDFAEVFILNRTEPVAALTTLDAGAAQPGPNEGAIERGEMAVWTYAGQAGEVITVSIFADSPAHNSSREQRQTFNLMDTLLVIRAPDGTIIAANDDVRAGEITDSYVARLELPVDGEYTIEVRTWQAETGGSYTLMIDTNLD